MAQSHMHSRFYGFYLDRYGLIRSGNYSFNSNNNNRNDNVTTTTGESKAAAVLIQNESVTDHGHLPWLKFITLFWNRRIFWAAIKFGLAAVLMNRYERLGFAVLIICFTL